MFNLLSHDHRRDVHSPARDEEDKRDLLYRRHQMARDEHFPMLRKVSLQTYLGPVFDQGDVETCLSNAGVMLHRYEQQVDHPDDKPRDASRLDLHWEAHRFQNSINLAGGVRPRSVVHTLLKRGLIPESEWQYDVTKIAVSPPNTFTIRDKASAYYRLDTRDLDEIEACLCAGHPVLALISLYQSFITAWMNGGHIPVPSRTDVFVGYHGILLGGFDRDRAVVDFPNSWGPNGGNMGWGDLPYDFVTRPDLLGDAYSVRNFERIRWS